MGQSNAHINAILLEIWLTIKYCMQQYYDSLLSVGHFILEFKSHAYVFIIDIHVL